MKYLVKFKLKQYLLNETKNYVKKGWLKNRNLSEEKTTRAQIFRYFSYESRNDNRRNLYFACFLFEKSKGFENNKFLYFCEIMHARAHRVSGEWG